MKPKKELDVDFIGGAKPLTKDEEKRISDMIRKRKAKGGPPSRRQSKSKGKKETAK